MLKLIIAIIVVILVLAALGSGAKNHYNPTAPAIGTTQGG